eukprot:502344-Prorocentrum_minimum.AAC.1
MSKSQAASDVPRVRYGFRLIGRRNHRVANSGTDLLRTVPLSDQKKPKSDARNVGSRGPNQHRQTGPVVARQDSFSLTPLPGEMLGMPFGAARRSGGGADGLRAGAAGGDGCAPPLPLRALSAELARPRPIAGQGEHPTPRERARVGHRKTRAEGLNSRAEGLNSRAERLNSGDTARKRRCYVRASPSASSTCHESCVGSLANPFSTRRNAAIAAARSAAKSIETSKVYPLTNFEIATLPSTPPSPHAAGSDWSAPRVYAPSPHTIGPRCHASSGLRAVRLQRLSHSWPAMVWRAALPASARARVKGADAFESALELLRRAYAFRQSEEGRWVTSASGEYTQLCLLYTSDAADDTPC